MSRTYSAKGPSLFESSSRLMPFIANLSKRLVEQKLEIVNSPSYLSDARKIKAAQEEIQAQSERMQAYGLLCGTTDGLAHLLPTADTDLFRVLTQSEVHSYYSQQALLTTERKKCTCDGLCALAFALAESLLKESSHTHITVELCSLRNWSHSLLHLSQSRADGSTESIFYDPWHQLCLSDTPTVAKTFSDEELGTEIEALKRCSTMISRTEHLLKIDSGKKELKLEACMKEANRQNDFSYFVACSSRDFSNPTETRPDPSREAPASTCVIS